MKKLCFLLSVIFFLSLSIQAGKRNPTAIEGIAPKPKFAKVNYESDEKSDSSDYDSDSEQELSGIVNFTISSFQSVYDIILPYLNDDKEVLFAMDWDNTITAVNGINTPLREGEKTKETIEKLQDHGVKTMILTSRLDGQSIHHVRNNEIAAVIPQLIEDAVAGPGQNGIDLKKSGALASNEYEEMLLEDTNCYRVIKDQFVFAGQYKGEALLEILQSLRLSCAPDVIVFIDNQLDHIESVEYMLKKTNYLVVLIHYPDENDING